MGKRGPSAQYAYGITIEAGNYNEVINGFEKRLKDLDKGTKTTTATFAALSEAMKSGKQVDFSKAEGQLTGLVAEMEEVAKWREQLAGGQKLSDMFDGLEQVKQSLGQVTGQLDKFGDNIEEIFSILQNVPQNTSKTFVDIRKVLSQTASDMNKIIAELNNPTEKTDVSGLKNQLSSLATDFVNEWNKAAAQGIKMDQVVDFKPFANIIKTAISGARSLGAEFNDVSASVTEATKNVVALYSVKHPTGMFKDLASELSSVENQSKNAERSASKTVATFKAAVSFVDKIKNSDLGIGKKSKELEDFLAKLQNPQITIKVNKDNVIEEFTALTSKIDEIVSGSVLDIDSNFLKSMSTDKLKELGDTLQNIVAIGGKYKNQLKYLDDLPLFVQTSFKEEMGGYSSDLKSVFAELESRLNEAKQSVQDLSNSLQQMVEKAGLKEIKVELGIKDDIDDYVNKINATITNIEKQSNRIKKIPVMLAFDNNDSDENKTAIETLKQNLGDLKKSIHDARTEINQDTKVIKQSILDALNVNAKDMVNVRAALEDAFNIEPLEILINDEFLVNQIQNALKNKTYDISLNANINGANYSGGGIPVSRVSSGGVPATQQSTAADKQEHASEGQSKAAEEQKSAAQTNDKSAQLLSKASQEMTAFVKKFANTYYRAKTQQKELDDKVASGGELNETERRRLSRANGSIRNLTPIKEYLQSLFGDKVDLSKITEEAMSKVLTSLMQSNGKGSFKGELLSEDLLGLLTGLKGKYRSKYGNGIGDLLSQLVGTGGKNGTLDTMFKSFGLSSATFTQTSARDYTAPDVLKYYQSFARLADIIDEIKIHPQNVSNELLVELSNILKGMQNRTTSEEYRANITEIGSSINALAANIKDYNAKVTATADLDTKEGEDYTPLLNMFKELYSKVDEATKATISSAIGVNPSEDIIKGDQLVKAREALSTISGDEASSKIASDLLRWLDRMIASDNVVLSRETLLSQLGKGQRGSGLKVATSKNGKGKMTAYGIANNVLSDLDADIYYDGMGNPIVINRKDSPTQKRKSLRMVKNLGASGRRFANGTQIYNKDNPRPKIEDERRPESSIKGTVDWGKRLVAIDAELAKTSSEYETAIKKRDESIKQIEQKEREISKQIDIARKNVEDAKGNLSDISQGTDMLDSGDINNIKSAIRDREKLYNLMAEMDKSYIPDFELSKRNVLVSDTYKQLIEERKSVRDKLSNYKKIASGQIVPTEYDSKVAEQENILANLNARINDELESQKQQMDKDTYSLLLKIIEQYKERQSKLKGLEKDLSKHKEGTKEHDKILVQIDSLKTNLNSMIDEISQIGATLGIDNKDLENAFSGMSSDEFFSSKDVRKKLEKEVENLSKFKKDSLADVSIFPDELKDLVQKRNELLSEKSDISHDKEQLKELRNGLKSAKKKGDQQSIEYYEERIKMISERVKEARPTKEINSEIKEIDTVIIQYIKDKISELKKISKTRFSESTLAKYEIDGTTFSRYKKDVSDKSSILSQLEQEARIIAQNKEAANSDVISLENKRKILEKQRELAQLQVDYNTKRMEELQLTEEIASLEKSDSSSEVLAQKRQQLAAVNAELSDMYKQIHASGSTTSYETLDESISADQKKLIALEKIIEAQKIIAQNEEMQNRARAKIKDSTSVSNIKHDSETGKFTTQYGNESKLTRYTTDRFKSIYTQSDDFTQFRNTLYEKAREKISEFQISTGDRITEIVDGMYQDALSSLVKKNFGKRGVAAHEKAFTSAILEEDELLKKAIDARILELETAEKAALEEIWSHKRKNEFDDGWSDEAIETEVERVTNLYNTKKSSILNGADFTELLHSRASQFLNLYHKHFRELIMEEFGDETDTKTLQSNLSKTKESAKLMLKGSIRMSEGNGEDSPLTPFGKRVTEIFNQNEAKIKEYIDVVYRDLDEKLQESIDAYMKEISSDETRLEGELASDVVFKDRMGNRINLAAEYRNANQYNLDRVTTLGQENKAQKEWIARLREYGGISDEEMKYIQEAKERALLKIYGGSKSEIRNLDILIGDVDTAPIEEATTSIANQTIKAAAEVAKKAADDKLSTPTVTSAEYKDAVKIVKEAIGSFRGITDKSKAEFYGTLGKEVKDAANLIYRTPAENRTKEGNALLNKMMALKNATKISVDTTPITQAVENADNAVVEHATETANTVKKEVESKKKTVSTESLKDLLLSDPSKVLEIAKSDPERVRRELFSYLEQYVSNIGETVQSFLQSWSNNINGLGSTNAAKVASYYFSEPYQFSTIFDSSYSGKLYQVGQNDAYLSRRLGLLPIESLSSLSSFGEVFKNIDIWQDIFDTLYPNNLNKIDFSKVDTTELQQYIEALIKDHIRTYMTGLLHIGRSKLPENDEPIYDGYGNVIDNVSNEMASRGQELKEKALSNLSKIFPGISEEDITQALKLPIKTPDEWDRISTFPTKKDTKSIQFMDTAFNNFLSTFGVPNIKDILGLAQEAVKDGAEKIVQKSTESAQQAISQGVEETELSDAKKLKLAKKELQNRIDTAKEIAQDGTKFKSKEVIKSVSVQSAQNPEYVFNEGVESTSEFVKEVWNLTEAFKAGANAANIEYGFATQNGKRIQLAKGDNGSVDFQRFYGDVDSLTHSHSYTKGVNNMVFSLADIDQLETLGTRNNLKRYNLIYDNEMMSLNLGKNSQEAAEAIADCYPQINDVVMAMLSREDGNSIPAENTEEMARILNGYLQKVVEDAGGRLSVVNSKGENVTSKYSITDDEYNKFNNVLAKLQSYYDNNFGSVSKSDYVSVIRQYLSEEFGKEFMANITSKSNANPHGGLYTEFSAIPEYDDEDKKMLDYAEQVALYSKKIVAAEKAFVESLQKMSNEDLMSFINQAEETLGVKKEPEVKPTLTKAQIAALNPDDVTALQKASIKQLSKVRNWNENNVGNIEGFLGADNKTLVAYKTQFEELAKIALDLKAKGESGTIITKDDISQLDIAISKTKELQTALTKEAQFKQMKDAGLIVSGKTKIKSTDSYSERQDIMAQYAKKYAAQNKSEYQFGQYDFINDKIFFNMIDSAGQVTKVIMGWSEAFNSAYIQSSKLQGSLDKITQEVYKTDEAIKAGEEYGFFQEQSEGVKAYKDALAEYEAQVKAVAKSSQKDLAQNFEALHTAQEKVINAGKDLLDKQKDAYGFNNAQKVIGRTGDVDAVLQNYRDQGINVNDIELVRNYNDAMGDLNKKFEELKKNGKLWDANEQPGLKLLDDRAIEAEKALLKADEAQRQLNGEVIKGKNAKFFEGINPNNVDQVKQAMEQYARSINGVDAQSIKWSEGQKTLSYSVRTGKHEVSDFTIGVKELTNEFYEARTGTRAVKTGMEEFLSSVGSKFKEVGRYLLSFGSFYRVWGEIQKGVTYVREIDSALTELKKVTDETDETYAQFLKTMSQTGAEVGVTVKDLTNMAANWARLGYNIQEAGELAKSTAVLLNVSEFESADEASEALISTIQAYGYAAEDSMHVVDVLNEIGNNFAISSDGLATALQDSASSLMAAGNNLEQSVAMVAAANKVLQDPNSVGAALRTISLRIRGTSVKVLEEMGEETDGVIDSVSKLQAKVKGLSGVDILTDTGAYKDTYTVIKEIAQVWDQMNDINRAALLELLAGKNRSNAMAALLTNIEDLEGAYESAMEAQGSAEAENEKYMNSIQGKIDQFNNALQTMWSSELDSGFIKFIVSAGTALVKFIDTIGLLPSILTMIGAIKLGKIFLPKMWTSLTIAVTTHIAALSGETAAIEALNGAKVKAAIMDSTSISNDAKEIAIKTLLTGEVGNETVVTDLNTVSKIKAALAQYGLNDAQISGILSAMGLTTANVGLGTSFKLLAANIWKSIKAILVYIATNPWTWLAIGATTAIIVIAKLTKTHQEYVKELKETSDEISDVKSNLSSLEDELKSVSDRIDELNSKDKLSFTEKEELKNLKAQNAELERSIQIEEQKEKRLQKKAAKNLNDAVKTDYSITGNAQVYKNASGEYVSKSEANDVNSNNYAVNVDALKEGYSKETVSVIQSKIIEYQVAQKELEKAKDELANVGEDATDKQVKATEKKVEYLQNKSDSAYDAISNTMDKIQEDYLSQDGVEWQYGNPDELEDWQKQMNANLKIIYDAQDKLAIGADNTGKAIKSAFSRVTLQTEFQDELKEIQDTAGITGEKLKEMYEADNSTDNTGMKALIQSLMDCGVIANASAEELQKVVDLSLELGDSASDAATANKKLARSQKMLQYSRLYKELHKYTDALRDGRRRSGELSAQDKKSVQTIREKMAALSEEISKYDILGDQMNEAKEAFTDFENAKKSSEENSEYIDTSVEMLQTVIDGFHSAEMGSETFKAAFKGLIPESVYKDLDTLEERYTAAGEYIKNTLSRYFKIEYDDDGAVKSVETTTKNIETFIEDAKEEGLMSFSDGVWTVEENNFKKFAERMDITESMLVAIGTQMDNIDGDWIMGDNSSFFDSFDMGTEANIYKTTKALADLDQQFIDIANNEKLTTEERQKAINDYVEEYTRLQNELSQNKENAINDIINYDNATKQVDNLQSQLQKATEELSKLKNDPNATEDQIAEAAKNANEIAENLQIALQNKSDLEKPSQILVEFAVANIEDEKAKIVAELGTIDASIKLTTTDKDGKEQINSSIIKQLDDGTYEINVDANLTEESKAKVQSYVDLLNKEAQINSYVEGDQGAKENADDLKKTYEDLSQVIKDLPSPKINTSSAQSAVNTLKKTVDKLKDSFDDLPTEVTTTVTTVNKTVNETVERKSTGFGWLDKILGFFDGNAHFDGVANASGTLGAEKTEPSLVGELGPELRVRGNRWEMLGENGAEFADVQKGDIIFNHKQTEELLKNGHISSRGKAFVGGTAYAGRGTSGTIFTKYATEKDYGGKVPDWYGHADLLYDAANSISDAAGDVSDAADKFEEVFDWFEVLLEEIEDNISLMNAKLENAVGISAKKGIYSEIINTEQFKLQELYEGIKLYSDYANKLLAKVPDQYKEMAKNGAVAITDFLGEANQEVVDSINNYREWAKKVTDLNQQLEETKKTIADTHVEIQNMLKDEYDNRISLITSVNDRIQDTIDLLDEEGKRSSAVMYEEMIKNSTKQLSELQSKRAEMQRALDEAVRSGDVARESTQWYEMVNAINDVDSEINDCRVSLEGFQNSINQLHWDNFEKFIDAIDNVGNEISNLGDLIDEEDVVDEVGNWTDKGITALGLYAQEMERAKYRAEQYGKEIEYLNQEYAAGKYSVDEYNEKLQELKDGQWDSIKSYEAAKKSIIDLNKTRVEAIKDGIQKEIDAYSELIDKKKEELSLQKDAHDFSKQVTEQQKNIANIQKQLAAMAGDNSASAIARRKQLEAELAAAQEELDELYYNHSVEKQQEALDKSLENYQDDKQNEMDALDESLKNEEQIIADSYATITANTESVAQTLSDIASQYGITLSDSVMQPWLDGANAIGTYKEQLDTSMSSFTQQLEALKQMYADLQNQADSAGRSMVDAINGNKSKTEGATYTPPTPSQPSTPSKPSKPSKPSAPSTGSSVTVKKSATRFSRDGGNGTRMQSWVPGSTFTVYQVSGSEVLIGRNGQYTGWVRLSDIEGYAKGAKKIQNNQLAMLDELGDELVLHAGKNGRLEYLTKGTSVVPADITSNLMKLGSLDPKDILERNRPSIGAPHVIDNSIELKMEFGSLVHVDTVSNDTLPYLQKMVRNEFDNCMKHVNQGLKKFVR